MKSGLIFAAVTVCIMVLAGVIGSRYAAAPVAPAPAAPAAPAPPPAPASSLVTATKPMPVPESAKVSSLPAKTADAQSADFRTQANDILRKIQNKLQRGASSEADLASELKEMDALLAANKANPSPLVSQLALMRAMIPVEFFGQPEESLALVKRVAADYPGTEAAGYAGELVDQLNRAVAGAAVRRSLVPGAVFPDFAVTDLQGRPLSPSLYKGKVVLVDFWATWCGPCMEEMPEVQAIYAKYHSKGLEIIGISLDPDRARLAAFLRSEKISWPQYCDEKVWGSDLVEKYGVQGIPSSFVIGRDGKIVAVNPRGPALEAAIAKALAAK